MGAPFDPQNPTKNTHSETFKQFALEILANMDIRDVGNEIAGRLQALIEDVKSGTPPKAAAAKLYQYVKNESSPSELIEEASPSELIEEAATAD